MVRTAQKEEGKQDKANYALPASQAVCETPHCNYLKERAPNDNSEKGFTQQQGSNHHTRNKRKIEGKILRDGHGTYLESSEADNFLILRPACSTESEFQDS